MTLVSKIAVSALFTLIAILAALILSITTPAYAGTITDRTSEATLVTIAGVVQSPNLAPAMPMLNNELYASSKKHTLICDVCPAMLPPTSGQIDILEALWIMIAGLFE